MPNPLASSSPTTGPGGSSTVSPSTAPTVAPTVTPTVTPAATGTPSSAPQSASEIVPLPASGSTVALPAIGGAWTGTYTTPSNNAPSGTTLTLTDTNGVPLGQTDMSKMFAGNGTTVFAIESKASAAYLTSNFGVFGFSVTVPASVPTTSAFQYSAVICDESACNKSSSNGFILGPYGTTVNGQTVSFGGVPTGFFSQTTDVYLIELVQYNNTSTPSPVKM